MYKKIPSVSFFSFIRQSNSIVKNPLPFHRKNFNELGSVFKLTIGIGKSLIFTRDEGLTRHMLQLEHKKYYKSPVQTDELGRYLGKGLLTSNGAHWLKQRRLIQPSFYKKKLENIKNIIVKTIDEELLHIEEDTKFDVFPLMSDLAFKVVGKSLFSYSNKNAVISRLQYITEKIQQDLIEEVRQPFKKWWFVLTGKIAKTKALSVEARNIIQNLIEERKKANKSEGDLLDILLDAEYEDGFKMPMEQLIDEILILFVAGHETTSNALVFALQLLAKHPQEQQRLFNEVQNLDPSMLTMMAFFEAVPFTKKCIDEAMRLYPPVYFSDRISIEEDVFENYEIKKGSTVLMSFYEIHRNTIFWDKPEAYNPDRFDSISKKELSNWFFPFGAGPRMCVGSNFAIYEMLVCIAELVKKYEISPHFSEIEIKPLITLKPLNAILSFKKR